MGDHDIGNIETSSSGSYTLDEALSTVGFGTYQSLALVYAGVGWLTDAMEISLLSFIGPAVRYEWSLSPGQGSLLTTAVFGGMVLGAYFWGFVADTYGRRMGIQCVSVAMFGTGLLSAFSTDYKSLVILRFFLGFGAGGAHVFLSWFLEFVPSSNRGAWMLATQVFWISGELLEASLAWIIMPRLGWRWLLALSSVPSLMVLLVSKFVPETPRYLFMKGRTNEAIQILDKVAAINRKELPTGNLVYGHQRGSEADEENDPSEETHLLSKSDVKMTSSGSQTWLKPFFELFSSELSTTTLLLWFLHFDHTFVYFGIQLMISALSSEQSDCSPSNTTFLKNVKNDSLYVNSFITYLVEIPGFIVALVLIERSGRKFTMETLVVAALVFMLPLLSHQNGTVTTVLLATARMLFSSAWCTLTVYAKEVYPTSVRATGAGLAYAMGRIGGMVCPLIGVGLVRGCHQTLAAIVFGALVFIAGICVLLFPFETRGRGLTDVVTC